MMSRSAEPKSAVQALRLSGRLSVIRPTGPDCSHRTVSELTAGLQDRIVRGHATGAGPAAFTAVNNGGTGGSRPLAVPFGLLWGPKRDSDLQILPVLPLLTAVYGR